MRTTPRTRGALPEPIPSLGWGVVQELAHVLNYPSAEEPLRPRVGSANVSDHQANERTFLAWLRTAIALMGFGFVVAKFELYLRLIAQTRSPPHPFLSSMIGIFLVIVGGVMAAASAVRYRAIQQK